jgi:outer membrane murein-binding lipoprotein Lpp
VRRWIGVATAVALLAGCSSDAPVPEAGAGSAATLRADVLAVSKAAAQENWPGARAALNKLQSDLSSAVRAGSVSPARAQQIRTDAAAVAADIAMHLTPTSTTPSPTKTTRSVAPPPQPHPKRHGRKKHGGGEDD